MADLTNEEGERAGPRETAIITRESLGPNAELIQQHDTQRAMENGISFGIHYRWHRGTVDGETKLLLFFFFVLFCFVL